MSPAQEELADQFARAVQYGDLALALELGKRLKAMRDEAALGSHPEVHPAPQRGELGRNHLENN